MVVIEHDVCRRRGRQHYSILCNEHDRSALMPSFGLLPRVYHPSLSRCTNLRTSGGGVVLRPRGRGAQEHGMWLQPQLVVAPEDTACVWRGVARVCACEFV